MNKLIKKGLGLSPMTDYEKEFFFHRNMIGMAYMSVIVVVLEVWMILSFLKYMIDRDKPMTIGYFTSHAYHYLILLSIAIVMLIYSGMFLKEKVKQNFFGKLWIWVFSVIGIWFGIKVGVNSFANNEQTFGFMTMAIFVCCVIVWKPLTGFFVSAGSFLWFWYECDKLAKLSVAAFQAGQITEDQILYAHYSFKVNLFTLWLMVFVFELTVFTQNMREVQKDLKLEEANAYLKKISVQDELTETANLRGFNERVQSCLKDVEDVTEYAILYVNIENFKSYNEKYGFVAGDEVLQSMATVITESFAPYPVGRVGDDHFVVLSKCSTIEEQMQSAMDNLEKVSRDVHMELKVGIYQMQPEVDNVNRAIDYARTASRQLIQRSGEHFRFYDEKLAADIKLKRFVIDNIEHAIEQGHIKVFLQPILWAQNRKLAGFEALCRWDDPEQGLLPPFAFIETLEEYRLISLLDKEIVRQVCELLSDRIKNGQEVVPVSVNFSQIDFEMYDVEGYLRKMCAEYNVPHHLIDVEVTESALTDDSAKLFKTLSTLSEDKHSLWLDDFGSGYSSLNVLKDFRFDILKIDMMFMRGFENKPKARPILKAIIAMAWEIGMHPLTEGVETQEQYDFLKEAGCERVQGYLFSKPVPPAEMFRMIEEGTFAFETAEETAAREAAAPKPGNY